jgi:hypothetical protein
VERQEQLLELCVVADPSAYRERPAHLAIGIEGESRDQVRPSDGDAGATKSDAHVSTSRNMQRDAKQALIPGAERLEADLGLQPLCVPDGGHRRDQCAQRHQRADHRTRDLWSIQV